MSEPIYWRKATDRGSVELNIELIGEDGIAASAPREALFFTDENGNSNSSLAYASILVAESATTRYYLARSNGYDGEENTMFQLEHVRLPAGEYKLLISYLEPNGMLDTMDVTTKLVVLPKPVVSVTAKDTGADNGAMSVALPELRYVSALTMDEERIDIEELAAAGGTYAFTGLASDDYSLRYLGGKFDEPNVIAVASDVTVAPILRELAQSGMAAAFESTGAAETTLYYKGAKDKIAVAFGEGVEDQRVTFKSSAPKIATVDAVGNVTAVAAGTATVTVTSGDGTMSQALTVNVAPVKLTAVKLDKSKLSGSTLQSAWEDQLQLTIGIDNPPEGVRLPVSVTISGGTGLEAATLEESGTAFSFELQAGTTGFTAPLQLTGTEGGHYTVTVGVLDKTASCTVDLEGFAGRTPIRVDGQIVYLFNASTRCYNASGKAVSGWMKLGEKPVYGTAALKGDLTSAPVLYFDPTTKNLAMDGVRKIDKKLYAFREGVLIVNAGVRELADGSTVNVAADAHLLTGWVNVDGTAYYFDPTTGAKAASAWVPAQGGKGKTWVNADGLQLDDNGQPLVNGEGQPWVIAYIQNNYYLFIKGLQQSGWVYFKIDKNGMPVVSKKTGAVLAAYCDPADGNVLRMGRFQVGSKEYPSGPILSLPPMLNKSAKYAYYGSGYFVGLDGAICKNVFADVWTYSDQHHYMYAKADGTVAKSEWIGFKGKSYYFDENGYLSTGMAETDMTVLKAAGGTVTVTAKLISAKKPAQGYAYYADGKKLTNVFLYDGSGTPIMALDKSGKPVSNAVAKARVYIDGTELATYAVGADGKVLRHPEMYSDDGYIRETTGGKYYAVDRYGKVLTEPGLVYVEWREYYGSGTYDYNGYSGMANAGKNGVLTRNALVKVTAGGQTYSAYFGADCLNRTQYTWFNGTSIYYYGWKGKAYVAVSVDAPETRGTTYYYNQRVYVVYKPQWAGWDPYRNVYLNKDGSIKAGWIKDNYGNRKYQTVNVTATETHFTLLTANNGSSNGVVSLAVYKIGGKLYLFDNFGNALYGWMQIRGGTVTATNAKGNAKIEGDVGGLNGAFYFDPKTGAAVAGGWKKAPVPVAVGGELSLGQEYVNIYGSYSGIDPALEYYAYSINVSPDTAKLYFNADGSLVRDTTQVIGKKLYKFAADGTSVLTEGWLDAAKTQYMLKNGRLAAGRQKIDGQYYFFDASGVKQSGTLRKSGAKWYYYDAFGVQATPRMGAWFGDIYVGGVSADGLSAVWNKDGSLAKIVYTASGKPAAGESVSFGVWDDPETALAEGLNGYVLDAKGLPATGTVTDFELDGETYGMLFNADGSRVVAPGGAMLLVNKRCTVLVGGLLANGDEEEVYVEDWSRLSAADRKTMDSMVRAARLQNEPGVRVRIGADGSVLASAQTADGHFTNRLGVPIDLYSPIFRFGGKWYTTYANGANLYGYEYGENGYRYYNLRVWVKDDGELINITNYNTGEPFNGTFSTYGDMYFFLKNGQPQTGMQKVYNYYGESYTFYLDADLGVYVMYYNY
ncbi:MAG: Ig-like domain-containing protein [Oscillospiraceae bacterium]|nr:Ig-like domain-containing protein [Oscillospiraceae bacterium]